MKKVKKVTEKEENSERPSRIPKKEEALKTQVKKKVTMNEMEEAMNQKFRELLIQYIEKHDLKQKDIAVKLGEDKSTISKFMKGSNWGIPKLGVAARIMGFDFEKEYEICAAIYNEIFNKHMEEKEKRKKRRRKKK